MISFQSLNEEFFMIHDTLISQELFPTHFSAQRNKAAVTEK
jgi:hypothetical protein